MDFNAHELVPAPGAGVALLLLSASLSHAAGANPVFETYQARPPAVDFTLVLAGDPNAASAPNKPVMRLTNDSMVATLTSFSISVGDTDFHFATIAGTYQETLENDPAGNLTFVPPNQGTARLDVLAYTFTGFEPNDRFKIQADMDQDADPQNVELDFQNILFDNGAAVPNLVLTAQFSTGEELVVPVEEDPSPACGDGSNENPFVYRLSPAPAAGFTLVLAGDPNAGFAPNKPVMRLTNDSAAATLTSFSISVGDIDFHFATIAGTYQETLENDPAGNLTFVPPNQGTTRLDLLAYTFAGFDPNDRFKFQADMDQDADPQNVELDFQNILFDNGTMVPNAILTAQFSTGEELVLAAEENPVPVCGDGSTEKPFAYIFTSPSLIDTDMDGILDIADNCTRFANFDQRDTDSDGIGSACDPDHDQNCTVNFVDLRLFKLEFFGSNPEYDYTGDGAVNFLDLARLQELFFSSPGPSGVPNLCEGS